MVSNNSLMCYSLPVDLDNSRTALVANIFTCLANSVFSLTAVCGNALVIFIIWKREILYVPYNALLCCLAVSDFVVGLIGQPSMVIYKVMEIREESFDTYCAARILQSCSGWLTGCVSLLTLCAISVDRYLALRLHLRYAAVVTVARVLETVASFWVLSAVGIAVRFLMKESQWMIAAIVILLVNIFLILVFYIKVFQIVRRHRRQIHERIQLAQHFHGRSAVEVARHKKSAVTMMYVLGAFILCYVPFLATVIAETMQGYTLGVKIAYDFAATFVFLSSSLNPLLYCWRIREIRQAAMKILRRARTPIETSANTFTTAFTMSTTSLR